MRALAVASALAVLTVIVGAPEALAHAQRQAGPIHMEIGFGTEPAYVGQPNSVQIILTEHGRAIVGLGDALEVTVSFGGQQTDLRLEPNFEVGGDGTPGDYRAWFIPSQPGPYTFHLAGTVRGTKIDETLTSGPKTFDEVQDPAEAAFPPVNTPTNQELADPAGRRTAVRRDRRGGLGEERGRLRHDGRDHRRGRRFDRPRDGRHGLRAHAEGTTRVVSTA
ncbi:MAG: hypothetical protein E6G63_06845 [Actinobacteria bacterium]|nr:MAG: hypothetical protein E6G63_06845 [Actinomycetota bacterium]